MAYPSLSRAIEGVHLRLLMNKSEIINSYWIGLQRAIDPAKHPHNLYKEIFNQPFHKQNLTAMYGLVMRMARILYIDRYYSA